jgi:glucose-6-phosphate isomerase
VTALLKAVPADGYISVQAYIDRVELPQVSGVRQLVAARAGRPVTFGWGPRFLHSTGQFHKGGPAVGAFIQILQTPEADLQIPERPFTFGQLISAQAAGDANVLADHGRPVLTLTLPAGVEDLTALFEAFN